MPSGRAASANAPPSPPDLPRTLYHLMPVFRERSLTFFKKVRERSEQTDDGGQSPWCPQSPVPNPGSQPRPYRGSATVPINNGRPVSMCTIW